MKKNKPTKFTKKEIKAIKALGQIIVAQIIFRQVMQQVAEAFKKVELLEKRKVKKKKLKGGKQT